MPVSTGLPTNTVAHDGVGRGEGAIAVGQLRDATAILPLTARQIGPLQNPTPNLNGFLLQRSVSAVLYRNCSISEEQASSAPPINMICRIAPNYRAANEEDPAPSRRTSQAKGSDLPPHSGVSRLQRHPRQLGRRELNPLQVRGRSEKQFAAGSTAPYLKVRPMWLAALKRSGYAG
jgi:hypothetical protein